MTMETLQVIWVSSHSFSGFYHLLWLHPSLFDSFLVCQEKIGQRINTWGGYRNAWVSADAWLESHENRDHLDLGWGHFSSQLKREDCGAMGTIIDKPVKELLHAWEEFYQFFFVDTWLPTVLVAKEATSQPLAWSMLLLFILTQDLSCRSVTCIASHLTSLEDWGYINLAKVKENMAD